VLRVTREETRLHSVFSFDEKTKCQALDPRAVLPSDAAPMRPGSAETMTTSEMARPTCSRFSV
jgi:hypothetical protein